MSLDILRNDFLWNDFSGSPLFALTLTFASYEVWDFFYRASGRKLYLNPLLGTTVTIILILQLTFPFFRYPSLDAFYDRYAEGTKAIHFMLGPATVALAVPLYEQRERIREAFLPLFVSLCVGSFTGVVSAAGWVWFFTRSHVLVFSMAPKSVTTPIAMAISEKFGGLPALTAAAVVLTGIFGAATIPYLYRVLPPFLKIRSIAAQGFGMGMASHGVGMARAFQDGNEMGAFAGLAIGLNGLVTALLIPILANLMKG